MFFCRWNIKVEREGGIGVYYKFLVVSCARRRINDGYDDDYGEDDDDDDGERQIMNFKSVRALDLTITEKQKIIILMNDNNNNKLK